MIPDLYWEPPAFVLWLGTGSRRLSLRWCRVAIIAIVSLLAVGSGGQSAPVTAATTGPPPPPILGTGLAPQPSTNPAVERLLGVPLLDSPLLHEGTRDRGLWVTTVHGPFGVTSIVFHVLQTSRRTWLTILELRSERPLQDSPWDMIVAQPTTLKGRPAKLYEQPGSMTIAWQEGATLHISLTEDSDQRYSARGLGEPASRNMLTEAQLLQLAGTLHPRGVQVGPFRLESPW